MVERERPGVADGVLNAQHAGYWQHLVDTGEMKSGSDVARAEGLHPSVTNELMRLTLLAHDILELLMAGRQPRRMNLIWFQRNPLAPRGW